MSTASPAVATPSRFMQHRLTLGHLIKSETIKLVSLTSPWISAAIVLVIAVGVSVIGSIAMRFADTGPGFAIPGPFVANVVATPVVFTMLLAMILGAILVTGEYATGMIRSTITAAPDRTRSMVAKAVVVFVFMFIVGLATSVCGALASLLVITLRGDRVDFSDPVGSFGPYILIPLLLGAMGLLGLGVGYILRSGAGAIAVVTALTFVLPIVLAGMSNIPGLRALADVNTVTPLNAAMDLVGMTDDATRGAIALAIWAIAALAGGLAVLKSRDV